MSSLTLSLDFEGSFGSNLFQYLVAVIFARLSQRNLVLPAESRLYKIITCQVGHRAESSFRAKVLVQEPFLGGYARIYAPELLSAWKMKKNYIDEKIKKNELFNDSLNLIKSSTDDLHLCGHFHDFDTSLLNQYKDILSGSFKFNFQLQGYALDLVRNKAVVTLHIRRGDVVFYHFFMRGAHYVIPRKLYKSKLKEIWDTLSEPILYIATNGVLENYLKEFEDFNPICYRNLQIDDMEKQAVAIDFEVMRHSRVLFCSAGFFSMMAAYFKHHDQQEAYYYDLSSGLFVKDDPTNIRIYRRVPNFSPFKTFPWREKGLSQELLRFGSQALPRILKSRLSIYSLLHKGLIIYSPEEVVKNFLTRYDFVPGREKELTHPQAALLRIVQYMTQEFYEVSPRCIEIFN
jgi:hypothetical protein